MSSDITALIRTYNSDRTLEDCLRSLQAQSLAPQDIIVVDSGSTDRTLGIARSFDSEIVHYPENEEFNYSRALNIGMEHVQTSHVLIVSSHVSMPARNTIEVMDRLLRSKASHCAASVRGWASAPEIDETDPQWEIVTRENFIPKYEGSPISNSCNLIPTKDWRQCQFDEDLPRCEDQKWLQYHLEQGRTAVRLEKPEIVYQNPYYTYQKDLRDLITLAKYDINPTLTEWRYLVRLFGNVLKGLGRGSRSAVKRNARLLVGLLQVRYGLHRDTKSKYF